MGFQISAKVQQLHRSFLPGFFSQELPKFYKHKMLQVLSIGSADIHHVSPFWSKVDLYK
jgi:hypothetical protein